MKARAWTVAELEDHLRCLACRRPTRATDDQDDPLRTCEAPSGAYVLCARCQSVAEAELVGNVCL